MTTEQSKPATWFWVVSVVALVWNAMGVVAYLGTVMMTPEAREAMTEPQRALLDATPA